MHPTLPARILVPTDFSSTAEGAFAVASRLARSFSAELHLLHVRVLLEEPHLAAGQRAEVQRLLETADRDTALSLDRAGAGEPGLAVVTHVVRGISAAEAIAESVANLGCGLVVMGTHGRRGLRHALLGSVAEGVARTAAVPVLTVGPGASVPEGDFRSVLVAHDFSEPSELALRYVAAWARKLGATVTLLHVVEPVVYPEFYAVDALPEETVAGIEERARESLAEIAADALEGVEHEVVVEVGRAAERIVARAQRPAHDLLTMGARGLSALQHLLLGSVAENVLRRAAIPQLTVRAPKS